jgi:hypothetical protein
MCVYVCTHTLTHIHILKRMREHKHKHKLVRDVLESTLEVLPVSIR